MVFAADVTTNEVLMSLIGFANGALVIVGLVVKHYLDKKDALKLTNELKASSKKNAEETRQASKEDAEVVVAAVKNEAAGVTSVISQEAKVVAVTAEKAAEQTKVEMTQRLDDAVTKIEQAALTGSKVVYGPDDGVVSPHGPATGRKSP